MQLHKTTGDPALQALANFKRGSWYAVPPQAQDFDGGFVRGFKVAHKAPACDSTHREFGWSNNQFPEGLTVHYEVEGGEAATSDCAGETPALTFHGVYLRGSNVQPLLSSEVWDEIENEIHAGLEAERARFTAGRRRFA